MWSADSGNRLLSLWALVFALAVPPRGLPAMCPSEFTQLPRIQATDPTDRPESRLAYNFVLGQRLVFHVKYSSTGNFDLGPLFQGLGPGMQPEQPSTPATSLAASFRGDLVATVLEKTDARVLVLYTLRNPAVQMLSRGREIGQSLTIQKDLTRDIVVELNPQGKMVSVWFDRNIEGPSKDFALTVLALTQFVLPNGPSSATDVWTSQEESPTGRYIARYRAVAISSKQSPAGATAESGVFRKTTIRYLSERQKPGLPGKQLSKKVEPGGSLIARFDLAGGHLVSLSGSEAEVTRISGKTVARTETTFRMSYSGTEVLNANELTKLREAAVTRERSVPATSLYVKRSKAEIETNIQRTELGTATLEGLLADLARAEAAHETNETPLYLKFKALVYVRPEACNRLGKILATAQPKSITMRILPRALGAVGHPQAQAALIDAIRARPNDWPALSTLIPALGGAGSATPETEKALRDLATGTADSNVASTAMLALGTLAHNLASTSPKRAENIVDWLIGRAEASTSEAQTRLLLLALGNAGAVRSLPVLARFTANRSPAVRAAAVAALRFIKSPRTNLLLVHALVSDADPQVRRQAVFALGFRATTAETFAAQKKALASDPDPKVRQALLSNFWKMRDTFPEARRLVEQSSQNDAAEEVRKAAAALLKGTS